MRRPTLPLLVLLALGAGACGTDTGEEFETPETDDAALLPSPAMQAEFGELRSEVYSIVSTLREQVDSLQRQAAGDTLEAWTQAATLIQESEGEMLMELDRLNTAGVEEAMDIRSDIASELAGLEGDVVRRQVRFTAGPGFTDVALALEERLSSLEQNLDSIATRTQSYGGSDRMQIQRPGGQATDESVQMPPHPGDTAMGRATAGDLGDRMGQWDDFPDAERIRELRDEIREVRGELSGLREADNMEEWNDAKEEIAEEVAELTRQVREHWYNVRYSFRDMTAMPPGGGMGMPRGEE